MIIGSFSSQVHLEINLRMLTSYLTLSPPSATEQVLQKRHRVETQLSKVLGFFKKLSIVVGCPGVLVVACKAPHGKKFLAYTHKL